MRRFWLVAAFLLFSTQTTIADEPGVCRPFARAVTDYLIKELWQRAYGRCILDTVPNLPKTFDEALDIVMPDHLPMWPIDRENVATLMAVDAPPLPKERPENVPETTPGTVGTGRSGFVKGSDEWNAYCKRYWPASFDKKSGTIIKHRHRRIPCPA